MLSLIPCGADSLAVTLEATLAFGGLRRFEDSLRQQGNDAVLERLAQDDAFLYGAGVYSPGHAYSSLAREIAHERLIGAIAVAFDNHAVTHYPAEIRGALGVLLQRIPKVYVTDELSVEWAQHYAIEAELGGHPGWLASKARAEETLSKAHAMAFLRGAADDFRQAVQHLASTAQPHVVLSVAEVIACGILRYPCIALLNTASGQHPQDSYSVLSRFATQHGVPVCNYPSELVDAIDRAVVPDMPSARARALETLTTLLRGDFRNVVAPASTTEAVCGTLVHRTERVIESPRADSLTSYLDACAGVGVTRRGASIEPAKRGTRRRVAPGDVFDPSTHYDDAYFAGAGGIEYMKTDGTWGIYHGPAKVWEGNAVIARILTKTLTGVTGIPANSIAYDLGCGAGDFVARLRSHGWDAEGLDISEAAFRAAPVELRPFLKCVDIVGGGEVLAKLPLAQLVTAFDFWEHIFERDVDALLRATRTLLRKGGLHVAVVCTRGARESDFVAEPGVRFTKENSWLLVSGHVNVRRWLYWARKFRQHGFRLRFDLGYLFQVGRVEDPGLSTVASWGPRNFFVLEAV